MQPKKIITLVAIIILLGTVIVVGTLYSTDAEVDELMQRYYGTTQNFDRVSVQHIISTVEENEPGINNTDPGSGGSGPGNGGQNPPGGGINLPPGIPVNSDFYTFDNNAGKYLNYGNNFTGTTQSFSAFANLKSKAYTATNKSTMKAFGCGFSSASFAASKLSGKPWTVGDVFCTIGYPVAINSATGEYYWTGDTIPSYDFSIDYLKACLNKTGVAYTIDITDVSSIITGNASSNYFYFCHVNNDPEDSDGKRCYSSGGAHWFIVDPTGKIIYKSGKRDTLVMSDFTTGGCVMNHCWKVSW